MVTHQLQVKRRPGKVRRSKTDVLPLSYAEQASRVSIAFIRLCGSVCLSVITSTATGQKMCVLSSFEYNLLLLLL